MRQERSKIVQCRKATRWLQSKTSCTASRLSISAIRQAFIASNFKAQLLPTQYHSAVRNGTKRGLNSVAARLLDLLNFSHVLFSSCVLANGLDRLSFAPTAIVRIHTTQLSPCQLYSVVEENF